MAGRESSMSSNHKGIDEQSVRDAWDVRQSVTGVAKELECSRENARRWLVRLGIKEPAPRDLKRSKSVKSAAQLQPTPEEFVGELVAMQLKDVIDDAIHEPSKEELLKQRIAELESQVGQ